ncbi:hypothetical protein [Protofrankia sp. BMG5.30]|uniref:hypothetical protein n=1 Tax=Protofrankia sp. BMG5.30 TaxID=1834514 RepID=UPI0009774847|nr:hypothetical protein [Protofrankia sp. BMG5.30]ONH34496.1 hypothetical protein BL254_15700 [Protofrankia sp. BMG5.30]
MTLPTGFLALPLDAAGGLPVAAPLPVPDGDLRAVVVAVAGDLAAVLGAAPGRTVWTSAACLERRPGPGPVAARDLPELARSVAVAALTAPPGPTLSGAEVRVVVLVVAGRRVLAAIPPRPGRPVAVLDDGRLRGHLLVDEVTVTAGALVAAGPTGARLSVGWRTLAAAPAAERSVAGQPGGGPSVREEDPYAGLV